MAEFKTKLNTV